MSCGSTLKSASVTNGCMYKIQFQKYIVGIFKGWRCRPTRREGIEILQLEGTAHVRPWVHFYFTPERPKSPSPPVNWVTTYVMFLVQVNE